MKNSFNFSLLILLLICTASCEDETFQAQPIDETGPVISNLRWIESPFFENDPEGPIAEGENYSIGLDSRYQFRLSVEDQSDLVSGEVYFEVNENDALRHYHVGPNGLVGWTNGSIGASYELGRLSLGAGEFYTFQAGDILQFYVNLVDEAGNTTNMTWSATLVE